MIDCQAGVQVHPGERWSWSVDDGRYHVGGSTMMTGDDDARALGLTVSSVVPARARGSGWKVDGGEFICIYNNFEGSVQFQGSTV